MTAAVRPAKPDDAAAVEQVRFASWQAAYGRLVPPEYFEQFDHAAAVTRWRDAIAIGARQAHVAELEGEIVGFCSYGPAATTTCRRPPRSTRFTSCPNTGQPGSGGPCCLPQ